MVKKKDNKKITKIIACSDIHIRNLRRQDEYQKQLEKFIEECQHIADKEGAEHIRIVIAGDLLHNKLDISGEGYLLASWFLKKLDAIAKTIVIAGNHDLNMTNLSRLDPLSTIFSMCEFNQTYYLDSELDYESGCVEDENVIWCLYSSFANFAKPNIDETKISHEDSKYVGLFHGEIKSSKTDSGYQNEVGIDPSFFDGLNFGIIGHIHKRQCIEYEGCKLVYCGSLIQQDHGENISSHGYVVWDVKDEDYEEINIPNEEYGFYTFSIDSIDDIYNDDEQILNL